MLTDTFVCPNCDAKYKVVRMEAPPDDPKTNDPEIACVSCGDRFLGREGSAVLKYFLFDGRRNHLRRLRSGRTRG